MPETFISKLVGVTSMNVDGLDRQKHIRRFARVGKTVFLRREASNAHDSNAIAADIDCRYMLIFSGRLQIGYLSREVAASIAPLMDDGHKVTCYITQVTGGGVHTLGANIRIDIPHNH